MFRYSTDTTSFYIYIYVLYEHNMPLNGISIRIGSKKVSKDYHVKMLIKFNNSHGRQHAATIRNSALYLHLASQGTTQVGGLPRDTQPLSISVRLNDMACRRLQSYACLKIGANKKPVEVGGRYKIEQAIQLQSLSSCHALQSEVKYFMALEL